MAGRFEDSPSGTRSGWGFCGEIGGEGSGLPEADTGPARVDREPSPYTTLVTKDSQGWLAFHGALHNRAELAAHLGLAPDTLPEHLLLAARERWPADWCRKLDGVWVMAQEDPLRRCVRLCRDASGTLGLFYTRATNGSPTFACCPDTLLTRGGSRPRLATLGLHEYLRLLDIAAPNTIYEHVCAVPPGEEVVLRLGEHGEETQLPTPPTSLRSMTLDAALDELASTLTQAIRRRLQGVERPAAFLSGGVDSALICSLAARERPDLTAITVGFEGAAYDETPNAAAIARHLGIRHEVLRFGREELLQALRRAGREMEQPMADPALPVTLLAFDWARQRYDAVLDGTGADELMGAMPPRHQRVAVQWATRIPAWLRRRIARSLGRLPRMAGYRPVFDFEHPAEPLMRWQGFRSEEIEALTGQPVRLEHTRFLQVFARFPPAAHYERYSALLEAMPCERLTQGMLITGLDVRFPFWSPEVESLLRALPMTLRWRPDSHKHLLRVLLARYLPRPFWDLPKHGFNFPLHEFLTAEDFRLVRRYLLEAEWNRWQVLSPEAVAGYARRFIAGEPGLTFRVWALVVLAAWLEGHGY